MWIISEVSYNFHNLFLFIVVYGALWGWERRLHACIAERAKWFLSSTLIWRRHLRWANMLILNYLTIIEHLTMKWALSFSWYGTLCCCRSIRPHNLTRWHQQMIWIWHLFPRRLARRFMWLSLVIVGCFRSSSVILSMASEARWKAVHRLNIQTLVSICHDEAFCRSLAH